MSNLEKCLAALQANSLTSSEVAQQAGITKPAAKVALFTLTKKQLVTREGIESTGRGPKKVYKYKLP
jgi:predicted ArsR family transcriptional regulator